MTAKIIDGKAIAAKIRKQLKEKVQKLKIFIKKGIMLLRPVCLLTTIILLVFSQKYILQKRSIINLQIVLLFLLS